MDVVSMSYDLSFEHPPRLACLEAPDFVNVADEVGLYLIERSGKGARVYVFAPGLPQVQVQAQMCSGFDADELERRTEVNFGL